MNFITGVIENKILSTELIEQFYLESILLKALHIGAWVLDMARYVSMNLSYF